MAKQKSPPSQLQELNRRLENNPQLLERLLEITALIEHTETEQGYPISADEIKELLIDQIRKLGNESLQSWGTRMDAKTNEWVKHKYPKVQLREKKR